MTGSEAQLARIVQLVAELTRRDRAAGDAPGLAQLAASFRVPVSQITADLRTLTLLGDASEAEWLLSLSVWQQGDRVSVSSRGPFQRPLRLTPEERVAVQAALGLDPDGEPLARRFAALWTRAPVPAPAAGGSDAVLEDPGEVVRRAAGARERAVIWYAGEGETDPREWALEPHQIVEYRDRAYAVSWCPGTSDWRHFRLDRVIAARVVGGQFDHRPDFRPIERPDDLFRPEAGAVERVTVRFAPRVARWVAERYPNSDALSDGSVVVTFPATSEAWLVRRVLEYGPDAVVLGPPRFRDAVRRAVA